MAEKVIHILLADDDEDDRLNFRDAVEQLNLNISLKMVPDGKCLLDYLYTSGTILPNILFLDLNLPCKDGAECLSEIRRSEILKEIFVAIYSTSAAEKDIEETFVKGANIYINKPNDFKTLKGVLFKIIKTNWHYVNHNLNRDNFLMSV